MAEVMLANIHSLPPDHKFALGAAAATLIVVMAAKFSGKGGGRGKGERDPHWYSPVHLAKHLEDWRHVTGVDEFLNQLGRDHALKQDASQAWKALLVENDQTTLRRLLVKHSVNPAGERRLTDSNARRIVSGLAEHEYGR